ncbi:MAG: hypothetical protein LBC74_10735 [Planctomycetaceae bacterium]|jgi:Mrp family chromosome partitioning ATPase|nr:hypothetical protein [Planctomycetaceae bacterium]
MVVAEVNNYREKTFKATLVGAAFISSRGEVYRLFQDADDPTLGNDFILNEIEQNELNSYKIHDQHELTEIENESESKYGIQPQFESATALKIVSDIEIETGTEIDNIFCNENYKQADDLPNQFSDQLFSQLKQDYGLEFEELAENNNDTEPSCKLAESKEHMNSERQFRIIRNDCESAVAELLALEVPKPIINVPEHIPPQDISFDEKIRRLRGVTGICGKFQPTIQEKIIGNTDTGSDNNFKSRFSVSKNQPSQLSVPNCSKVFRFCPQTKPVAVCEKLEIKLSFQPCRDNTVSELNEIMRGNLVPILDSTPEIFNSVPTTISFNQKTEKDHTDKFNKQHNFKIVNTENNVDEIDRNIVTINNDGNEVDKILPFQVSSCVQESDCVDVDVSVNDVEVGSAEVGSAEVGSVEVGSVEVGSVEVGSDVISFQRKLYGYELPDRIKTLLGKANEQVADLGDRFIDFINAGKRIVSVNGCFAGDGCSQISMFTAIELASRNKRVLLIDANYKNPALANLLEVGDISEREIITLKDNFDFVTLFGNKITTKLKKIFRNNKNNIVDTQNQLEFDNELSQFIGGLSNDYDFILFDTGCIADVPFNNCVNNWRIMCVDGIFLIVHDKNFKSVNFNNITKRLKEHQIELLGIMMVCRN